MTIKEFIEVLKKCNPNAEICVPPRFIGFYKVAGIIDYCGDEEMYIIKTEDFPFYKEI